jgi:hypothetical protein
MTRALRADGLRGSGVTGTQGLEQQRWSGDTLPVVIGY